VTTETYLLEHGFAATVVFSDDERAGQANAPITPKSERGRKLWSLNGHYWETCDCAQCGDRRLGLINRVGDRT
jgi:hypothetical protein